MTSDYLKSATMKKWTCYDFGYVCYRRGDARMIQKKIKRSARRADKMALNKLI